MESGRGESSYRERSRIEKDKIDKSTGSREVENRESRRTEGHIGTARTGKGTTAAIVGKSLARVNQAVESDQGKGDRGGREGWGRFVFQLHDTSGQV